MERIPLHEQREKWRTARSGFAKRTLPTPLARSKWPWTRPRSSFARRHGSRAPCMHARGHQPVLHVRHGGGTHVPREEFDQRAPRFAEWVERIYERSGVKAALAMPDKTNPALRTFTGEAR